MAEAEYEEQIQIVGEQYKIWKKHVPFLYWVASTYQIPTCTQTVEWLRDITIEDGQQNHHCVIGTNSTASNKLMFLKIELATDNTYCDNSEFKYDAKVGQFGLKKIIVEKEIGRNTEINKARVNHNAKMVAVKCGATNYVSLINTEVDNEEEEEIILEGHSAEGMALEWNPLETNLIASGSADRRICVWDIEAQPEENGSVKPITDYIFHSMGVEEVTWNRFNPNILASCSQDRLIAIWDLREKKKKPEFQKSAHSSDVLSISFSPFAETLLLSGGDDSEVGLWDIRYFSKRIHTFLGHSQSVNCLKWSPTNRTQFVTGSSDRSVMMWNLQNAGTQKQIMFIHAGHRSRVLDLDINPNMANTVLSSEECNLIQVWCPSETALQSQSGRQVKQIKMEVEEQNQ